MFIHCLCLCPQRLAIMLYLILIFNHIIGLQFTFLCSKLIRYLKMQGRRRQGKNSKFSVFSSRQFLLAYFVKCMRTLLEWNFQEPYPISERKRKFCCGLFTSYIRHEIRHFHVASRPSRTGTAEKCTKSVINVQSCCFAHYTY